MGKIGEISPELVKGETERKYAFHLTPGQILSQSFEPNCADRDRKNFQRCVHVNEGGRVAMRDESCTTRA